MHDNGGRLVVAKNSDTTVFAFGDYAMASQAIGGDSLGLSGYVAGGGIQHQFTSMFFGGVTAGYGSAHGSVTSVYNAIANSQVIVAPYGRIEVPSGAIFDFGATLSSEMWSYDRVAGASVASASITGSSFGLQQPIYLSDVTVTPFGKLSFLHTNVNAYSETGAGAANLSLPSYSLDSLEVLGGVGVSKEASINGLAVRGYANLSVGDDLSSGTTIRTAYTTSATQFNSTVQGRNGLFGRLELGSSIQFTPSASFDPAFQGTLGSGYPQAGITAGLKGHL